MANEPRLLRGMLRRAISRAPGLQVAGETTDPGELSSLVRESGAQWVITSLWPEGLAPSIVQALLIEQPALSILGMAADGSRAKIARLIAEEETRQDLSWEDLLTILSRPESAAQRLATGGDPDS